MKNIELFQDNCFDYLKRLETILYLLLATYVQQSFPLPVLLPLLPLSVKQFLIECICKYSII